MSGQSFLQVRFARIHAFGSHTVQHSRLSSPAANAGHMVIPAENFLVLHSLRYLRAIGISTLSPLALYPNSVADFIHPVSLGLSAADSDTELRTLMQLFRSGFGCGPVSLETTVNDLGGSRG